MRWVLHHTMNQSNVWTMNEPDANAELKYNKEGHSFRLKAGDKRLFFLERKGLFQNRMLLKTEYNVVVGETNFTRNGHAGQLEIDGEKFNFTIKGNELHLFNKDHKLVDITTINELSQLDMYELSALLFGLGRISHHQPVLHELFL
jgi:hypothetical protein